MSDVKAAVKHDGGKPPLGLIHRLFLEELARVLAFGLKKYGAWNWLKGMDWSRPADAALRHVYAWLAGEDTDHETSLNPLAHAAAELMFLIVYQKLGLGTDDRAPRAKKIITRKDGAGAPVDVEVVS